MPNTGCRCWTDPQLAALAAPLLLGLGRTPVWRRELLQGGSMASALWRWCGWWSAARRDGPDQPTAIFNSITGNHAAQEARGTLLRTVTHAQHYCPGLLSMESFMARCAS
jgi:hypothetical protein